MLYHLAQTSDTLVTLWTNLIFAKPRLSEKWRECVQERKYNVLQSTRGFQKVRFPIFLPPKYFT